MTITSEQEAREQRKRDKPKTFSCYEPVVARLACNLSYDLMDSAECDGLGGCIMCKA